MSMLVEKTDTGWEIVSFHNLDIEYELVLRNNFPSEEEKVAYAKKHYQGWYR